MPDPSYPHAVSIFRGDNAVLCGVPILALNPDEWEGAPAAFNAVQVGDGTGATDWFFEIDAEGVPHAVLSFSTLEPHTHILLALSVGNPEHLAALEAMVATGRVMLTPLSYFEAMPNEGEPLTLAPAPIITTPVDAERVHAFLGKLHSPPESPPA